MKFFTFFSDFLAKGAADKTISHHLTDSFTGIEHYWNPPAK